MQLDRKQKKPKQEKVLPKLGDIREKERFALFPKKIEDKWVWFERYIQVQKFTESTYTEEIEISSGLIEDVFTTTGLVNSRFRTETFKYRYWASENRKIIKK